jgi:hypothetical protein
VAKAGSVKWEQYVDYATDLLTNADIYFNETMVRFGHPDRVAGERSRQN